MTDAAVAALIAEVIALERISNTIAAESDVRIQGLFRAVIDVLQVLDPTAPSQLAYRRRRTEAFLKELQVLLRAFSTVEEKALKDRLVLVGRFQAKRAEQRLIATLGDIGTRRVRTTPVTQQRLRAILNTDPFQGRLLSEHVNRIGANAYVRVRDQVRLGMVSEESIPDMVRRIRGSQAGFLRQDPKTGVFVPRGTRGAVVTPRFVGGAISSTTREAEALVRTAVTHISTEGMRQTFAANRSILTGVGFVATLDDRTTEICLSLDGTVWPADSPDIQSPPLHWKCRSTLVAEVDWDKLGMAPPEETPRSARDLSGVSEADLKRRVSARRRTGDLGRSTRVPSSVRASEWLRRQPVRVQAKLLGAGKARLFREGKISLGDIVRRDGRVVPLSELEAA